jgi:hypothetical protein
MRSMAPSEAAAAVRIFPEVARGAARAVDRVLGIGRTLRRSTLRGARRDRRPEPRGRGQLLRGRFSVDGFLGLFFVALPEELVAFLVLLVLAGSVAVVKRVRPDFRCSRWRFRWRTSFSPGWPRPTTSASATCFRSTRSWRPQPPRHLPRSAGEGGCDGGRSARPCSSSKRCACTRMSFHSSMWPPAAGARREWLNDSNLDWGQDLMRLDRPTRRGGGRRVAIFWRRGSGCTRVGAAFAADRGRSRRDSMRSRRFSCAAVPK